MNMSMRWWLLVLSVCGNCCGYTKFNVLERPKKKVAQSSDALAKTPFMLQQATHSFSGAVNYVKNCEIKNYVYLTSRDKKKIQKALAPYSSGELISDSLIQKFKSSGRLNNNMVGLVLQDFKRSKQDATIGYVLETLNHEAKNEKGNNGTHAKS